jgi:phosphohistidine phosphatase SixA
LSARGEEEVRRLADFLRGKACFAPEEIWHSPLRRAVQTAERLARDLGLTKALTVVDGLRPEDDPRAMARRLEARPHSIAIVGHEPFMSALGSLFVTGRMEPPVVVMKKGAVLALEGSSSRWSVRWHVSPEVLG